MTDERDNTNVLASAAAPLDASPNVPLAPPTTPGMRPRPPALWPSVIGVVGIIYGVGGVLASASQLLAMVFFRFLEDFVPPNSAAHQVIALDDWKWIAISTLLYGLLSVAAAMLIAGSVGLLRRRAWGAKLLLIWSVVRIALSVADSAVGYAIAVALLEASPLFAPRFVINWTIMFGTAMELIIYSAFPVFVLIWFTLAGPRREVKRWQGGSTT